MHSTSWTRAFCACGLLATASLLLPRPLVAAGTFYVDVNDNDCSDSGPGAIDEPYCSIGAAVTARGGPGATILVEPGTYREELVLTASGTATAPFVIRAVGASVVIDGADDYGQRSLWTRHSGQVYLARSVSWAPKQVFVNGERLAASTAAPGSLAAGTFRWIEGQGLYVRGDGQNPGRRGARVGRRAYGFRATNRSWILIEGFEITRHEEKSVFLSYGSAFCTVRGNTLSWARTNGVGLTQVADILVDGNRIHDHADHGINMNSGATRCTIRGNDSHHNARPTTRAANGLYMFAAPANTIERNRFHDNQDSGVNIQSASNDNILLNNLSWSNGDHGYDVLYATGTLFVGDVAWGNVKDGFSIEGTSTGTRLYNCVGVNNGTGADEYDLYVEPGSEPGFASDFNLFWNASAQEPVRFAGPRYATMAAFTAATGNETRGLQSDPRFANPAGGNFRVISGSPLIDSGTSSCPSWPATDGDGNPRWDIPGVENSGTGVIDYADRGAYEYFPAHASAPQAAASAALSLSGVFPNPARSGIRCVLELPAPAQVRAEVLDLQGRRVWSESRPRPGGRGVLEWNGAGARGPGVYTLLVRAGDRTETRRFVVIR